MQAEDLTMWRKLASGVLEGLIAAVIAIDAAGHGRTVCSLTSEGRSS